MSDQSFVTVTGARQNNLRGVDVRIPRDSFVVFTGVSGSGKSSLAFGTIYAEAQRRYFDSVAPYARRLLNQLPAPHVSDITGLPPAVALQQRRAEPTSRSSVGTLTKLSNSLRMLFSRLGTYPEGTTERLDSDSFSANTHVGACPTCHGIGIVHTVTENSLVPDPTLTIREKAIAAWPGAWQGKNYRDILAVLGYNVDIPWKDLPQKDRDWILFTEERPVVTVHAEREAHRIQRPYQGTYVSAASYVRHTYATTNSTSLRKRAARYMEPSPCQDCHGKRLKASALAVKFAGYDIADMFAMPLVQLARILSKARESRDSEDAGRLLINDILLRIELITELGLDYLSMERPAPTLSPGELQRLRLISQIYSGLFGVVYILDEPSAGLHPADSESLVKMLRRLKDIGNSLFVVDHEMDIARQADWIVDIGPGAGDRGGMLLYSGPVAGLKNCSQSATAQFLFEHASGEARSPRSSNSWMTLREVTQHNLENVTVEFPLGVLSVVTGVSGSGKSTLINQLSEAVRAKLGIFQTEDEEDDADKNDASSGDLDGDDFTLDTTSMPGGKSILENWEPIKRFIAVDQKPIGRTPRSNLATYTGIFDIIRKKFAATEQAKANKYTASRFSFNVTGGRCETCQGEGFLSVELLFLPSVYSPCSSCGGARYNSETLAIKYRDKNIAQVLDMTVDAATEFFADVPALSRALKTMHDVGLDYLRLGQPATELSGGEAQRIKLATELQRAQSGHSLYILDEPTTGLHPADVQKLIGLLQELVCAGNTVIVVEHDLDVISAADHVIDLGPGAGTAGGTVVARGTPVEVARSKASKTAVYLRKHLALPDIS